MKTHQLKESISSKLNFRYANFFMVICLLWSSISHGQTLNNNWEKDLSKSLDEFVKCAKSNGDKATCGATVGQSLATVYKQDAFFSQKLNRFLVPNEISQIVEDSKRWKLLGFAYDQKVLDQAQEMANTNKPVIAVYRMNGSSHVVLILPGALHFSGSWGFKVPNSASFSYIDPDKSYVGKGLSYGFAKSMMKNITLYQMTY